MNAFKKVTFALLVLVLVAGSLGLNVQPAAAASTVCTQYYTVQRGDYLVKIARLFGVTWRYLAEINNLYDATRIYPGQKLCVKEGTSSSTGGSTPASSKPAQVWAVEVVEDKTVTIEARYLSASARYDIMLARYSLSNTTSYRAGTAYSDKNGTLRATFSIPRSLRDVHQLYVFVNRGSKNIAENWFYNQTGKTNLGGDEEEDYGNLSIKVVDVIENQEVSIQGRNFPVRTYFDVSMADRDASKLKWIYVARVYVGSNGRLDETITIPKALWNADQISILVESQNGKYDASTWFYNRDDSPVTGSPYLTAVEVVRDEEVTIKFTNLQAGVKFIVMLGDMSTRADDGVVVGTVQSAQGGTVYQTFTIPNRVRGNAQIAIRMENTSGFHAYNWFWNQTTY